MGISGRILIIDDEATLRQTLARILQGAGMEVTTAGSGAEGLAFLSGQPFDLVYLDIRMPDMSGMEALKVIHKKNPELPVILFTAQPDLNSAIQAMREGAIDYLLKPLHPKTVIERTQTILAQQQIERRKREIQLQIEALQAELKNLGGGKEPEPDQGSKEIKTEDRFLIRGKLNLDLHARRLVLDGETINLPPTSFDYLLVLARHAPNVVDYQTLVVEAQGFQADSREAQDLSKWHIHQIRQAIESDASNPTYVINARGIGYRLVAD